jgi:hypothetical protein
MKAMSTKEEHRTLTLTPRFTEAVDYVRIPDDADQRSELMPIT